MAGLPVRIRVLLLSALVALAGCAPERTQQELSATVAPAVDQAQGQLASVLVPAVLAFQEAAQASIEPLPLDPPADTWAGAEAATALIVRWEVTSPAVYAKRYQGVICPGGASGPTIGIGYDLGHQTRGAILRDWSHHPDVARLANAAGQVGEAACAIYRAAHRDIRVPYAMAAEVFQRSTLPAYHASTRRAFAVGWPGYRPKAQAAAVSLVYNRGASMKGDRNREKRAMRDTCIPATDYACSAGELRGMCRLWAGTPNGKGLCGRRDGEAVLTLTP